MTLGYTIFLRRTREARGSVEYTYSATEGLEGDSGVLEIDRQSGEIRVLRHVGGSIDADRLWERAAMKLRRAWRAGELPDELLWVS
jgi:hypothetical protein